MNGERFLLPTPPPAPLNPNGFVPCPPAALPPLAPAEEEARRALYEWALAQARAVVAPSLPERDLLGVWN